MCIRDRDWACLPREAREKADPSQALSLIHISLINVSVTLLAAYPLSRKDLPFRGFFMFLFTFTMFFSGGLIPTYLLVNSLRLVGSFWSLLLPGALSVYNMILTRTFMQSNIPSELLEAAQIDGCSDLRFFFNMVLPLSKAVIAVIALYYAVGHWKMCIRDSPRAASGLTSFWILSTSTTPNTWITTLSQNICTTIPTTSIL